MLYLHHEYTFNFVFDTSADRPPETWTVDVWARGHMDPTHVPCSADGKGLREPRLNLEAWMPGGLGA